MSYPRISTEMCKSHLSELHRRVTSEKVRVELTCEGSSQTCVIISSDELDSLESALELLSRSESYQQMEADVCRIAELTR